MSEPAGAPAERQPDAFDADIQIKTYRYLRIGMLLTVGLLTVSVLWERFSVTDQCWQTSISAYYYTPVRAIFVGALLAIGISLITIKGSTWLEDSALNAAGFLAPIVAFVPTSDVGTCSSSDPGPLPTANGEFAPWVIDNIDNNVGALIWTGFLALVVSCFVIAHGMVSARGVDPSGRDLIGFFTAVAGLAVVAGLFVTDRLHELHGESAVAMFGFLALAAFSSFWSRGREPSRNRYRWAYLFIGVAMVLSFAAVWYRQRSVAEWDHAILWLEVIEISLFAVYWLIQTIDNWHADRAVDAQRSSRQDRAQSVSASMIS